MKRFILIGTFMLFIFGLLATPVMAQGGSDVVGALSTEAIALAIAAAGCGYAQSKALTAGCEGVSRNPGAQDTIRFFIILGLAFIEFLALLTFLFVAFIN